MTGGGRPCEDGRDRHLERDGREAELLVDAILVGVGRKPNVEGLGLDRAGIDHGRPVITGSGGAACW